MKTINKLQIVTLLTSVIFVLFVSLPAIFTGIELFSIAEDIQHYNAQHSSVVWVPVTILFGVLPIVYFRQIARWIYRKVLILYATQNKNVIIKRI